MIKQARIFSQNKPSRQVGPHKLIPPTYYKPNDFQTKLSYYSDRFTATSCTGKIFAIKKVPGLICITCLNLRIFVFLALALFGFLESS